MLKLEHRSARPGYIVGDHVFTDVEIERLFRLLNQNPHVTATALAAIMKGTGLTSSSSQVN